MATISSFLRRSVSGANLAESQESIRDAKVRVAATLALGVGLAIAVCGSASATPVSFTWDPSAVGLTTSPVNTNIVANNFNVSDFADLTFASGGAFTENAVLTAVQFLEGGNPVPLHGLQDTYSFYITVAATGHQNAIPAAGSGLASDGVFSTLNYTFWANPNSQPQVTLNTGGTPSITGNTGAFALFSGSLIDGTTTLIAPTGGGYSPTANLDLSLVACSAAGQMVATGQTCTNDENAFFVAPLATDFHLVIGNFGATTSVTTLTPGNPTYLDINGGGGNITFAVTEPAAIFLLGSGLIGLAVMRRRSGGQGNPIPQAGGRTADMARGLRLRGR